MPGEAHPVTVKKENLRDFLDLTPIRHDRILETKKPGIVTGLAWTQAGGEILFIETLLTKGSGKVVITGRLGDVMKESVQVSLRGVIMPIGGLPEKLMAAQRAGVKQVFIPEENVDDLRDVAQEVKDALKIVPVHQVSEVLDAVFQDSRSSRIVSICN